MLKTTPPRRRRQAQPRSQIVEAVGTASGVGTAAAQGGEVHPAAGSASGNTTTTGKGGAVLAGGHKHGFRKNWGKLEFAQDALQACYPERLPVYVSVKVLEAVHKHLAHDPSYRATYGDHEIDRTTVTRALQILRKITDR